MMLDLQPTSYQKFKINHWNCEVVAASDEIIRNFQLLLKIDLFDMTSQYILYIFLEQIHNKMV